MRTPRSIAQTVLGVLVVSLALGWADPARASSFSINPTRIVLTARVSSVVVTLRNETDEPLRFQVSAYGWRQSPEGEMDLTPTDDIVFFPPLFTIAPRDERRVRVGAAGGWGETEVSYRLFIDELPSLKQPEQEAGLRVLTRMGIPVFLQPARTSSGAALEKLGLGHGTLAFTVRNTGNVHFIPNEVVVRGRDEAGAVVFEQPLESWYILAGGLRAFSYVVTPHGCARTRKISVEVRVGESVIEEHLETPAAACSP